MSHTNTFYWLFSNNFNSRANYEQKNLILVPQIVPKYILHNKIDQ